MRGGMAGGGCVTRQWDAQPWGWGGRGVAGTGSATSSGGNGVPEAVLLIPGYLGERGKDGSRLHVAPGGGLCPPGRVSSPPPPCLQRDSFRRWVKHKHPLN